MRDLATVCTVDKAWDLPDKDKVHGISMVENGIGCSFKIKNIDYQVEGLKKISDLVRVS